MDKTKQFFCLITDSIAMKKGDCSVVATKMEKTLSNFSVVPINLQPCNHEEADTRMFMHVQDIYVQVYQKVNVAIVDTDVVRTALHAFQQTWPGRPVD